MKLINTGGQLLHIKGWHGRITIRDDRHGGHIIVLSAAQAKEVAETLLAYVTIITPQTSPKK